MKSFLIFLLKLLTIPLSFFLSATINLKIGKGYTNDFPFNLFVILYILFGILVLIIVFLYLNDVRRHKKYYIKFGVPILSFTVPLFLFLILVLDKSFASNKNYRQVKVIDVVEYMSTPRCTCETTLGILELDLKDCINVDSISVQFSESLFKNKLVEKKLINGKKIEKTFDLF
jgi:hypothetical protein